MRGLAVVVLAAAVAAISVARAESIPVVAKNKGAYGAFGHGTYPSEGKRTHIGVDVVPKTSGTAIVQAFAPGKIIDVIRDSTDKNYNSLGLMVIIEHPDTLIGRKFYTAYFHLANMPSADEISIGKSVEDGFFGPQVLGEMGSTGAAQGRHLHFEIRFFPERYHPKLGNIYGKGDISSAPHFKTDWADPAAWFRAYPNGMFDLREQDVVKAQQTHEARLAGIGPLPPKNLSAASSGSEGGLPVGAAPTVSTTDASGMSLNIANEFHTDELAAIRKYSKRSKIRIGVGDVQMSNGRLMVGHAQVPSSLVEQHQRNYEELDKNFSWNGWFKTSRSFGPANLSKYLISCVFDPANVPPLRKGEWAIVTAKLASFQGRHIVFNCSP